MRWGCWAGEYVDETPKEIKNTVHKPPVFFLGRNSKVQEVSCRAKLHTGAVSCCAAHL